MSSDLMGRDYGSHKHLIERAILDIQFDSQPLADEFQAQAQAFMLHQLLPAIDEVFEQHSQETWVLSIETLVIDLGELSGANYREHLVTRVSQALALQLNSLAKTSESASGARLISQLTPKLTPKLSTGLNPSPRPSQGQAATGQDLNPDWRHQDISELSFYQYPKAESSWRQLKYFLEHGNLSWNTDASGFYQKPDTWTAWFEATVFNHLAALSELLKTSSTRAAILVRLLRQLNTDKSIACLLALQVGRQLSQLKFLVKLMFNHGAEAEFTHTQRQFFTSSGWLSRASLQEQQAVMAKLFMTSLFMSNSSMSSQASINSSLLSVCSQYAPSAKKAEFTLLFAAMSQVASQDGLQNQRDKQAQTQSHANDYSKNHSEASWQAKNELHQRQSTAVTNQARQGYIALLTQALLQGNYRGLLSIWPLTTQVFAKEFVSILNYLGQQYSVRHALASGLTEPMLLDILTLLEPRESRFILGFRQLALAPLLSKQALANQTIANQATQQAVAKPQDPLDKGTDANSSYANSSYASSAHTGAVDHTAAHQKATLQKERASLQLMPLAQSHQVFWEFTLSYLLVDRGSAFNRKAYLYSMIKQAAAHQNVSQAQLHHSLYQSVISLPKDSPLTRNLQQLLSDLSFNGDAISGNGFNSKQQVVEGMKSHKGQPIGMDHLDEEARLIALLAMALTQGRIGLMAKHWRSYIGEHRQLLRQGLTLYGQDRRAIKLVVAHFTHKMLHELLTVLAPNDAALILSIMAQTALMGKTSGLSKRAAIEQDSALVSASTSAQAAMLGPGQHHKDAAVSDKQLWQFSLSYLLTERGSVFNKLSYLGYLTQQMAAHHNLNHQQLVRGFVRSFSYVSKPSGLQQEMLGLLVSLLIKPMDLGVNNATGQQSSVDGETPVLSTDSGLGADLESKSVEVAPVLDTEAVQQNPALQHLLQGFVLALELADNASLAKLLGQASEGVKAKFRAILLHYLFRNELQNGAHGLPQELPNELAKDMDWGDSDSEAQIKRYLLALSNASQLSLFNLLAPHLSQALAVLLNPDSLLLVEASKSSSQTTWLKLSLPALLLDKLTRYSLSQGLSYSANLATQLWLICWRFICIEAERGGDIKASLAKTREAKPEAFIRFVILQMAQYRNLPLESLLQAMLRASKNNHEIGSSSSGNSSNVSRHRNAPQWLINLLSQWLEGHRAPQAASLAREIAGKGAIAEQETAEQTHQAETETSSVASLFDLVQSQQWLQQFFTLVAGLSAAKAYRFESEANGLDNGSEHEANSQELRRLLNLLKGLSAKDFVHLAALMPESKMQLALLQSIDWKHLAAHLSSAEGVKLGQLLTVLYPSLKLTELARLNSGLASLSTAALWRRSVIGNSVIKNSVIGSSVSESSVDGNSVEASSDSESSVNDNSVNGNSVEMNNEQAIKLAHSLLHDIPAESADLLTLSLEDRAKLDPKRQSARLATMLKALLQTLAGTDLSQWPRLSEYLGLNLAKSPLGKGVDLGVKSLLAHDNEALKILLLQNMHRGQVMDFMLALRSDTELVELMTFCYGNAFTSLYLRLQSLIYDSPSLVQLRRGSPRIFWTFICQYLAKHHCSHHYSSHSRHHNMSLHKAEMAFLQWAYSKQRAIKTRFSTFADFLTQVRLELRFTPSLKQDIELKGEGLPRPKGVISEPKHNLSKTPKTSTRPPVSAPKALEPLAELEALIYGDKSKNEDKQQDEGLDKIYVANGGLVLIAPYIGRLFTRLALTEKGEFIDEQAREKALHLLQYIAYGREGALEFQLGLNKILCGMKTTTPLSHRLVLTHEDKNTADGLLTGVIQNWTGLGNTSNDGLRQTFLQREGVITLEKEAWKLRIQPKAFDVLLDSLPWSFGVIKLPWMERVMHVEWR
ncbi:hypothetical protein Sden_2997 [Shewanella denitrificans OS217]|uniref:Uncharacterized protein n=1 Tax=Shewanella denitrificans (strain OS217 / ATCC BAA-1090 / DSM 15013) TaxID=318161 RepID=Q12JV1_SHEDO|nr:contractile injection system tape measure protein [Shewanella denitrificans]ABE56275.1 hypothetical protein Sden_2997 [Shewanella denitrificans OS217]